MMAFGRQAITEPAHLLQGLSMLFPLGKINAADRNSEKARILIGTIWGGVPPPTRYEIGP
jgi:hypothetical protein